MPLTEVLALKSAPVGVGAIFRAFGTGEVDRVLQSPARQGVHLPGRAARVSNSQASELAKAYRTGASIAQIAAKFGLSKTTVAAHLHVAGVVMRNHVSEHERRRIVKLATEGHSLNKLGKLTGRDPKTVKALLEDEEDTTVQQANSSVS
ncbi:hypothetical protein GCM10010459_23060 [Microbacterium schleiferi]